MVLGGNPHPSSISGTMAILKTQSAVAETIVDRVKPLRFAEQGGSEKYDGFFKQFNEAGFAAPSTNTSRHKESLYQGTSSYLSCWLI
jgi:hypothetical protein